MYMQEVWSGQMTGSARQDSKPWQLELSGNYQVPIPNIIHHDCGP